MFQNGGCTSKYINNVEGKKNKVFISSFEYKGHVSTHFQYLFLYIIFRASLVTQMVKNLPAMQETWVQFLGQEEPLKRQPIPGFLPEESHGQRSLVGCSPWGWKELTKLKQLRTHVTLNCTTKGHSFLHNSFVFFTTTGLFFFKLASCLSSSHDPSQRNSEQEES